MKELAVSVQMAGWFNPMFGDEKVDEGFAFAKEMGYEAFDLGLDGKYWCGYIEKGIIDEFYTRDIPALLEYYKPYKEAAEKYGIAFGQAHAPFPMHLEGNDEINAHLITVVEKCAAICEYLGCPALVVHPWVSSNKDREREVNLDMYRKMIPIGKKYKSVKLCLENIYDRFAGRPVIGCCCEAREAVWYIDTLNAEAGEEIFGFCYDLGHANITKRNFRADLKTLGDRVKVLHLHETDSVNDDHFAPFTQRKTDWDGLIAGLRDINYRGSINFETCAAIMKYPTELIPSMLRYIADVGKYLRNKILEEAQ